jgi:hypothetical protein
MSVKILLFVPVCALCIRVPHQVHGDVLLPGTHNVFLLFSSLRSVLSSKS